MTVVKKAVYLFVLFLCVSVALAEEAVIFKTYPLVTSDTNAVIEAVRALAGDKTTIFFYKPANELLVSATSNQHIQISALLKEINIPSPNIRIDIVFLQAGKETDYGIGVTGKGNTRVTKKGTSYQVEINPTIRGQSTVIMDNNSQTVVVKSGRQARIFMGHEVPFYQWLVDLGLKWNYINIIEQKFEMKQVGSSLIVEPTVIGRGPLISITLIPEISGVVDGKPHRIQYTRVATEITVRNGETTTIGSFGKNSEFYNKFLVGVDGQGNTRSVQVKLTAHIMNPQTPASTDR